MAVALTPVATRLPPLGRGPGEQRRAPACPGCLYRQLWGAPCPGSLQSEVW